MATAKQTKFQKKDTTNPKHKKIVAQDRAKEALSQGHESVMAKGVMYAKSGSNPTSKLFDRFLKGLKGN